MSKYKFGKQKKTLEPEAFAEIMLKGSFKKIIHKAFLVLLYYTGARVSEILNLKWEDFEIKDNILYVDCLASKHGVDRPPYDLPLQLPHMKWVYTVLKKRKKGLGPFTFTRQTAWNIIKRVMPKHYPHYFRLNRAVQMLAQGKPKDKVRIWFGWKQWKTIENYFGISLKATEGLSEGLA